MFKMDDSAARERGVGPANDVPTAHPVVILENEEGSGRVVIVCDHASNHVPPSLGRLGLSEADLSRHIAWDPGALAVARHLARRLDAPLVASGVSRLVIDCNRDPAMPDSILALSEDTLIPGNVSISDEERGRREASYYRPFHRMIETVVERKRRSGPVALVALHSFTPIFKGIRRPWHVGILFDRDRRLSDPIIAALAREDGLTVGANEPYNPRDRVYHTLDRHAQSQGLANVMIEVRNDLVATSEGEALWGARLAAVIAGALDRAFDTEPETPAT
jgi:predicted N-formylglutamate amidohydrolase